MMMPRETNKRVLFVAAENGALRGAKVGGIADVVHDLPLALAARGWQVTVISPGYDALTNLNQMQPAGALSVSFGGSEHQVSVSKLVMADIAHIVVDHPLITCGSPGQIYHHDVATEPFATDATRFAFFSAAAATWALRENYDVIHLHDWHAAAVAVLRKFAPEFAALKSSRTVYTIHNLALQGVRPLRGHPSSLFEWFPTIEVDPSVVDLRWPDCVNLMRAGINQSDRVNTVSKTYAREILAPNDAETAFHGGEGLEADLQLRANDGTLTGIQNGCEYPRIVPGKKLLPVVLLDHIRAAVLEMAAASRLLETAHILALDRIDRAVQKEISVLVTSIGRITEQKFGLLRQELDGRPVLHHLLQTLKHDSIMLILGTGTAEMEAFFTQAAGSFENLVYVQGFGEHLSDDIYRSGQLFLMPSTFEPSGLSQLLALRAGQPCLVHAVGGLSDTVVEGQTGWTFAGDGPLSQAKQLLRTFQRAYAEVQLNTNVYRRICENAASARFSWADAAAEYEDLYQHP